LRKCKTGIYVPRTDKWTITKSFDTSTPQIKYRSSWELDFCRYVDRTPGILKANSEGLVIPYINPITGKRARYFIDFVIQTLDTTFLIEVKPFAQTRPPRKSKNVKQYMERVKTYKVNLAKWDAAKQFAEVNNVIFKIITEKELYK